MYTTARSGFEKVNLWVGYVAGVGNLIMGLILFLEVAMRYFFGSPTVWAEEVAIYIFMWTMFAGTAYTLHAGKHIRIDLIITFLPKKTQAILDFITGIIAMAFCVFVTIQSWEMVASAVTMGKLSTTPLRFPLWIPQSSMLIGFALLTVEYFFIILDLGMKIKQGGNQA